MIVGDFPAVGDGELSSACCVGVAADETTVAVGSGGGVDVEVGDSVGAGAGSPKSQAVAANRRRIAEMNERRRCLCIWGIPVEEMPRARRRATIIIINTLVGRPTFLSQNETAKPRQPVQSWAGAGWVPRLVGV